MSPLPPSPVGRFLGFFAFHQDHGILWDSLSWRPLGPHQEHGILRNWSSWRPLGRLAGDPRNTGFCATGRLGMPSSIEAQKGSGHLNLKYRSGPFLSPCWSPYWPYVGPLGSIFGLIFSILARRAHKSKNEGPPIQNGHFWGLKRALEGPCWGHVGVKLASSGHLNISHHHLSDEPRYKGG